MKTSPAFWPALLLLGVVAAAVFAADRYAGQSELKQRLEDEWNQIQAAQDLAARHPQVFAAKTRIDTDLKQIVQSVGAKHAIPVVYLNETERESGEKMNERNVVVRVVNVPHASFVRFLAEVEQLGNGARFKDIRMKPAEGRTGVYQEAEAVLALRKPRS